MDKYLLTNTKKKRSSPPVIHAVRPKTSPGDSSIPYEDAVLLPTGSSKSVYVDHPYLRFLK